MGKLFSTRELFYRYKWLADLRMNFFVWWCNHGTAFFDRSYRRIRVMSAQARALVDSGTPVVFAFYHQHVIGVLGMYPRKRLTILISNSRDGEMIARAMEALGFTTARGSSGKGGVKAALRMIDALRHGQNVAFMVDGPRGPLHEVKPGILRIAEMSGAPIIPLGFAVRGSWYMGSWDRFNASSWGSPMLTVFGDPLYVPANPSEDQLEQLRLHLEQRMQELQACADQLWNAAGGVTNANPITTHIPQLLAEGAAAEGASPCAVPATTIQSSDS